MPDFTFREKVDTLEYIFIMKGDLIKVSMLQYFCLGSQRHVIGGVNRN